MILCSGGDGTLNHVMSKMMEMEHRPVLSYVPAGSTNDFAKGLGIPSVRSKAIAIATEGKPFAYDIGKMNGNYFNYVAAFGAFSKVSYATDQELKNVLGYAAYVVSALAELPQNIGYSCHMKIEADGVLEEGDYVFGAVSNSASVAGMPLFADDSIKQDDGLMELILIHAPKNFAEFNAIVTALATKEPDNPYLTYRQVKSAKFISDDDIEWTLDGEFGGAYRETEITVMSKAITIMTRA
jgi:YegS/Rv2252/BmrU family lipid kinase